MYLGSGIQNEDFKWVRKVWLVLYYFMYLAFFILIKFFFIFCSFSSHIPILSFTSYFSLISPSNLIISDSLHGRSLIWLFPCLFLFTLFFFFKRFFLFLFLSLSFLLFSFFFFWLFGQKIKKKKKTWVPIPTWIGESNL